MMPAEGCGALVQGVDPDPLHYVVIEVPPITTLVYRHRLFYACCSIIYEQRWQPM